MNLELFDTSSVDDALNYVNRKTREINSVMQDVKTIEAMLTSGDELHVSTRKNVFYCDEEDTQKPSNVLDGNFASQDKQIKRLVKDFFDKGESDASK